MVGLKKVDSVVFFVGEQVEVFARIFINKKIPNLVMGCGIKDRLGQMMFGTNTYHTKQVIESPMLGSVFEIRVKFLINLGPGSYSLHISIHSNDSHIGHNYDWRDREHVFEVINADKYFFVGSQWNPMEFQINE
jgi:lipopolysaccharide transport system ATP-binding protein